MPQDVILRWNNDMMEADLLVGSQDLIQEDGLETAVIISLFTDRRARADDALPDPAGNKRGWWGDLASPEVEGDQTGSRLWLLEREKTLDEVLARAKEYAKESLQWMIEDGIAVKIEVNVERMRRESGDILAFAVQIYKKSGTAESLRFEYQWQGTGGEV